MLLTQNKIDDVAREPPIQFLINRNVFWELNEIFFCSEPMHQARLRLTVNGLES